MTSTNIARSYKAMSLLLGGPRYYEELRGILDSVEDQEIGNALMGVLERCGSTNPDLSRTQYTSCFVADIGGVPCPPYESWYREGRIHGRVVYDLSIWYRKHGATPTTVPEDHAAAVLEFAAVLYGIGLADEGDQFVREHVLTWMGKLAEDVINKCHDDCMKSLGRALSVFIRREAERLKVSQ